MSLDSGYNPVGLRILLSVVPVNRARLLSCSLYISTTPVCPLMLHSTQDNAFWDLLAFARSRSNTETQNNKMNVLAQMDMTGLVSGLS